MVADEPLPLIFKVKLVFVLALKPPSVVAITPVKKGVAEEVTVKVLSAGAKIVTFPGDAKETVVIVPDAVVEDLNTSLMVTAPSMIPATVEELAMA